MLLLPRKIFVYSGFWDNTDRYYIEEITDNKQFSKANSIYRAFYYNGSVKTKDLFASYGDLMIEVQNRYPNLVATPAIAIYRETLCASCETDMRIKPTWNPSDTYDCFCSDCKAEPEPEFYSQNVFCE